MNHIIATWPRAGRWTKKLRAGRNEIVETQGANSTSSLMRGYGELKPQINHIVESKNG